MATVTLESGAVSLRLMKSADMELLQQILLDDFEHDPAFSRIPGETEKEYRRRWLSQWFAELVSTPSAYPFLVYLHDEPVGFQLLEVEETGDLLVADTSSFLVAEARGQRLGVDMRYAVLEFAFDRLKADRAISSANLENIASHRVSERSGYRLLGDFTSQYNGLKQTLRRFEITREEWLSQNEKS